MYQSNAVIFMTSELTNQSKGGSCLRNVRLSPFSTHAGDSLAIK